METITNLLSSADFLWLKVVLILLASLHFAVAIWVGKDVFLRSKSLFFQIFAVAIAIFLPIFGLIVYLLLRPHQAMSEKMLDNLALYLALNTCHSCKGFVRDNFEFCPHCGEKLLTVCDCKKKIPLSYAHCPFCGVRN